MLLFTHTAHVDLALPTGSSRISSSIIRHWRIWTAIIPTNLQLLTTSKSYVNVKQKNAVKINLSKPSKLKYVYKISLHNREMQAQFSDDPVPSRSYSCTANRQGRKSFRHLFSSLEGTHHLPYGTHKRRD